tara:strand:+ start:2534 stop:4063 length:1530 start_codon:yes stop_codon:yes gene_type:complete
MSNKNCIFWHRKDLRMHDNLGLSSSTIKGLSLIGVYIFDPEIFHKSKISHSKAWFILESLKELKLKWEEAGSKLLLIKGKPIEEINILSELINAKIVIWNKDVEPYSRERDSLLAESLNRKGIEVIEHWDQLLIEPGSLKTKNNTDYKVFGPFFKRWENAVYEKFDNKFIAKSSPSHIQQIHSSNFKSEKYTQWMKSKVLKEVPSLNYFGMSFEGLSICPCKPGEYSSKKQLERFCKLALIEIIEEGKALPISDQIFNYKEFRDIPSKSGTSFLSAALSTGTLSPRDAYFAAEKSKLIAFKENSNLALSSIHTWKQELVWREFYQHSLFNFPFISSGPFRKKWKSFPWENNKSYSNFWEQGLTGFPIIDAAMRQLMLSGWMHNRCRMIVASFLVKDLICDWKIGESIFMKNLVDADLASNNGGWQWSASSGMDAKPLRIFNPSTQASKFDPQGIYIRRWLPELTHVNTNDLISGEIIPIERRGYPSPIVNHNFQQSKFKEKYAKLNKIC